MATYADPVIGGLLVRDVQQAHILKILEPIWTTKTETASRLRGRIESVLDYATARGYRKGANPARWRGHLDKMLATPSKVAKVEHQAALDYTGIGPFMAELRQQAGMGARALEFAIITAARSGEVRGTWFDKRRRLMADWAKFCDAVDSSTTVRVAAMNSPIAAPRPDHQPTLATHEVPTPERRLQA